MKKFISAISILFLAALVFAQPKTIKVGMTIPCDERTGRNYGYEYEYLQEISKFTGWNYEFESGSKNYYTNGLKNGSIDVAIYYPDTKLSDDLVISEYPMMTLSCYIFKAENNNSISSEELSTLDGKKIGIIRNSSSEAALKKYEEKSKMKFKYIYFNSFKELKETFYLHTNVVDAFCLTDYFASGLKNIASVVEISSYDLYVLFNKENTEVIKAFNKAQKQLKERNPYFARNLKEKYYEFKNPITMMSKIEEMWLENHDSISIGYVKNGYPLCDQGSGNSISGLLPIFVDEILRKLNMEDITVSYHCFDTYEQAVEALQNYKITVLFPMYGDFYEADRNNIQKSENLMELSLGVVHKRINAPREINTLLLRESFRFLNNYADQYLPDFEQKPINFSTIETDLDEILKYDKSAVLLSDYTIELLSSIPKYRKLNHVKLQKKCPVAFGVRRDDVGFLSLLDRGISLLDPTFIPNTMNNYSLSIKKYYFSDFLRDNFFLTLMIFGFITLLIISILILYIKSIKRNKANVEQAKADVDKALQIAKVASQAKSNFLNNMSHDIRTPMNAIIGFTNLAQNTITDEKKVSEYLSKIQVSSMHLLNLINDVLDMSRIESGKVVLDEKEENLLEVVEEMRTIIQSDIEKKHFTFNLDTTQIKNPNIICDKLRFNQIVLNLLSNAIKFTPENGQIDFVISELDEINDDKHQYCIIVRDNGIGMSKEFQENIFESFERENTSTISKIQGTGLGMAITKKLVEMMGGSISLKSEKNFGSEFTVLLAFNTVDISVETLKQKTNLSSEEMYKEKFRGKKILLVEDNDLNQEIAVAILENLGFVVDLAENGAVAVVKVRESDKDIYNRYDTILMDIQMPVMNGYDATRAIRDIGSDYCKNVPILAMTANAFEEDKKEAIATGMNGHIAKPIDVNVLIRFLASF